jgi:hypothetical protein
MTTQMARSGLSLGLGWFRFRSKFRFRSRFRVQGSGFRV